MNGSKAYPKSKVEIHMNEMLVVNPESILGTLGARVEPHPPPRIA